jgi:membrane-bound lytic murein transglycosylase D
VKSSYAAARYLRDLYKIFGDWNLVIAAYNCGPENINKAIHRANAKQTSETQTINKDYWYIYPYLPAETRGYVPAFIAANYIMTYYCEHNICPMTTRLPAQSDTVMVHRDVHLEQIAGVIGTDADLLRSLNPEYRRDIAPGNTKPCAIRMPLADTGKFIDNEDSIYNYRVSELLTKRLVVDVNDDLPTFSRSRGSYSRRSGRYSRRSARNSRRGARSARSSRRGSSSVTVQRGQTLSQIAKRNGTTVAKLRQLNGIKGNNIRAGKKLRVR